MTNELIQRIYNDLRQIGSCDSRGSFSVDFLGSNEAYYRTVQARGETISVQAQAYLAAGLRNIGMCFVKSEFPQLRDKGAVMLDMHEQVLEDLFERVTLNALTFEAE